MNEGFTAKNINQITWMSQDQWRSPEMLIEQAAKAGRFSVQLYLTEEYVGDLEKRGFRVRAVTSSPDSHTWWSVSWDNVDIE